MLPLHDAGPPRPIGSLYVHVPFCRDRCTYCAFTTLRDVPAWHAPLLAGLGRRLAHWHAPGPLRTLYLGGGTPALLAPEDLATLLDMARSCWTFDGTIEITLECNPSNVTPDSLAAWSALGINRLSLGVQTFDDHALAHLARLHDGDDARSALERIAARWPGTWSADLLVGWHGQTVAALIRDLDELLAFGPPHVSVYGLTVEPRTPLEVLQRLGRERVVPEALHPELDAAWTGRLQAAGLHRYEASNYARPGHASRHNLAYWANEDYLGLGPGAASSLHPRRWVERSDTRAWMEAAQAGHGVRAACERLTPAQRLLESLAIGLRTRAGLAPQELDRRFGPGWRERLLPAADPLLQSGLLLLDATLRLPPAELPRADAVVRALAAACLDDALPAGAPA